MSWRNLIWMLVILGLAGLALYLSRGRSARAPAVDPAAKDLAPALTAYKVIRKTAYWPVTTQQAVDGAIEGMVRRADPYARFLDPAAQAEFRRQSEGRLHETGLRIAEQDDRLIVLGALPGSPAEAAALPAGSEILNLGDTQTEFLTLRQARARLEDANAESVRMLLRSPEGDYSWQTLDVATFPAETVTGLVRDGTRWDYELEPESGVWYVRIHSFVPRTPSELQQAYRRLGKVRAMVLDLRGNPGGMFPPALEVADRFLTEGVIAWTVNREGDVEAHYAHAEPTYPLVPTVILVDGRTASAAEIVAGAIHSHGRAVLLGEDTYGKWWGQQLIDLGLAGGKLYWTTAEYFLTDPAVATRPVGGTGRDEKEPTTAQAERTRSGLTPDEVVRIPAASEKHLRRLRLEAEVVVSLPKSESAPDFAAERVDRLRGQILSRDDQLARALYLLKSGRIPTTRPAGRPRIRPPLSGPGDLRADGSGSGATP